jgi:hypothetical protein
MMKSVKFLFVMLLLCLTACSNDDKTRMDFPKQDFYKFVVPWTASQPKYFADKDSKVEYECISSQAQLKKAFSNYERIMPAVDWSTQTPVFYKMTSGKVLLQSWNLDGNTLTVSYVISQSSVSVDTYFVTILDTKVNTSDLQLALKNNTSSSYTD